MRVITAGRQARSARTTQAKVPRSPFMGFVRADGTAGYAGQPDNWGRGEDDDSWWYSALWNDWVAQVIARICEFGGQGSSEASYGSWYYQMCRWNSETTACEENECRQHGSNEAACAVDHKCEWETSED
eukprot:PhM_4_TR11465/c0_g1_i1/m.67398